METFLRMIGDYGKSAKPDTIAQRQQPNGGGPSEDIARLQGARFVNISEPDKKLVLSAALVKTLTGNDTIIARHLHENSFEYRPEFKLFVNTNYLPQVTDVTLFSSGRVKVIPFERHFSEDERDRDLKADLAKPENLSGILNWCIEGLKWIDELGFDAPSSVMAATAAYQMDSDKFSRFLDEEFIADDNAETTTMTAYARYQAWCARNGFRAENMKNFKAGMMSTAPVKYKRPTGSGRASNPQNFIVGYRLTDEIMPANSHFYG